jgi:cytochrome c553
MKNLVIISALSVMLFIGCKSSKAPVATAPPETTTASGTLSYARDIQPIIELNCTNCHGYGGPAGYDFTNMESVKRAAVDGHLLGTIKWLPGYEPMPARADKLSDATIAKIELWIKEGMQP